MYKKIDDAQSTVGRDFSSQKLPSQKPTPLPRKIKSVDFPIEAVPPTPFKTLQFQNPIYSYVNPYETPNQVSESEIAPRTSNSSKNFYEEVDSEHFKRKNDSPTQFDEYYGTVSKPQSIFTDSFELLSDIQFQSPFAGTSEDSDQHYLEPGFQFNSEIFNDECETAPPDFPPPPLPIFDDNLELGFPISFSIQEVVPNIPIRSNSSHSSGSESNTTCNTETKPPLPPKKNSIMVSSPPIIPCRQPPKPPRKSKDVLNRISLKDLYPVEDYLYITGSHFSKSDFVWRWWCELNCEEFRFFSDKDSKEPMGSINCKDIISISYVQMKKMENTPELYSFIVHIYDNEIKQYIIGSTLQNIRFKWIARMVGAIVLKPLIPLVSQLNQSDWDKTNEFCRAGHLFIKEGISGKWQEAFFLLQHNQRSLHICNGELTCIDLRKVINLKMKKIDNDLSTSCPLAIQQSYIFYIDLPKKTIYIQSKLNNDTIAWFQAIHRCLAMGNNPSLYSVQLTSDNIPVIVNKLIDFVATHGHDFEGIYRIEGQLSKVKALLASFSNDAWSVHLKIDKVTPAEASSALKQYFRNLDKTLLTRSLYDRWIESSAVINEDERLGKYKDLIAKLPVINYSTLKFLMEHLYCISENAVQTKMSSSNLAIIFAVPLILKDANHDLKSMTNIVNDLIKFYPTLFNMDAIAMIKAKNINKAIEKLKFAHLKMKSSGDFLVEVHIFDVNSTSFNVKIPPTITAEEVVIKAVDLAKLTEETNTFLLYEILYNGDMERIIPNKEVVLPVVAQWSKWSSESDVKPKLVIKRNNYLNSLKPILPSGLFSELKYADHKTKSFKKAQFEFSAAKLSYYKNSRNSGLINCFNIEDINWYLGCEKSRNAPSKWALTFVEKKSTKKKLFKDNLFFGTTVCFESEKQYLMWIGTMLHAEHPTVFSNS